jgi:flagellar protein FliS
MSYAASYAPARAAAPPSRPGARAVAPRPAPPGGTYGAAAAPAASATRYRDAELASASPGQLVVMLFDRCLLTVRRAEAAFAAGDVEARVAHVCAAADMVTELRASLDFAAGGQMSRQLDALYVFVLASCSPRTATATRPGSRRRSACSATCATPSPAPRRSSRAAAGGPARGPQRVTPSVAAAAGPDGAAVAPWDARAAARARLEDEAATAVALLERFGDLLGVALDAAGSGDDDALEAAVAERAWVMAELEPLLASLAAARRRARGGRAPRRAPADEAALARILGPVDEALGHARLLHERLTDEVGRRALLAVVR